MNKIELLAPAGNLEKLKMAIIYGADAVYLAGQQYGLRASADNFTLEEMKEGIEFAHERGKKVYVTMNIIPHNKDLDQIPKYVEEISKMDIDAIIVADPGILSIVKEVNPSIEVHLSTQANNTNWKSAEFWYKQGVKRIVLARELSLEEIRDLKKKTPNDLELEVFVHGAMCISYSGRCLLSNYMVNRDSNRGACAHPCRWKYYLVEEKRPGEYMPVYEDDRGTYIYNSKDLCMIEYIPELIDTGVQSLKIEGRMKSSFYVATVVKAYREALDLYYSDPAGYKTNQEWIKEVSKASHRDYTTGFFFEKPSGNEQIYTTSAYIRGYDFIGMVLEYDTESGIATVEQRNRMFVNEEIEVVNPKGEYFTQKISGMKDSKDNDIEVAPHPQMIVKMPMERQVDRYTMLRKKSS